MDYSDMQPALDGLAPKTRARSKEPKKRLPAESMPIARVVLDVQAAHLGRTFDYLVEEKFSETAVPGVRVRVRFGGKLLDGFIWERAATSTTDASLLRYIERVISPIVMINAQMRADIERIADIFGGTRANIIRVAVPPRVARIERERGWSAVSRGARPSSASKVSLGGTASSGSALPQSVSGSLSSESLTSSQQTKYLDFQTRRVQEEYAGADAALATVTGTSWKQMVWDCLPGLNKWAEDLAWVMVQALESGRSVVVCVPHHRAVATLSDELKKYGLNKLVGSASDPTEENHVVGDGDFAVIDSSETQESRYRSYVALCSGALRCAIGTRAAMYAPVNGAALFAVVDDNAYQNTDGFMPYANVRDVLQTRARLHHGVFLALGLGRSPASQHTVDAAGSSTLEIVGYPSALKQTRPWIRWMNAQTLQSLGDVTAGSRIPHTVSAALAKAAQRGPVLIAVPYDGYTEVLSCAQCHRQARCRRCSGPLRTRGRALPVCAWCARPANGWVCRHCGSQHFRAVRIGAQGTAAEIRNLFRGIPLVVSTPTQPRGVVETIPATPRAVIATPGAQPRVEGGQYQALAILDAWTSMYSQALDARTDTLNVWMDLASLVVPASEGGQVHLVGQCYPDLAQSLVAWDSRILARRENQEREEAGLPPTVCAASVWGKYSAVMEVLGEIGALDGDFAAIPVRSVIEADAERENGAAEPGVEIVDDELPSVMGPIEIPPAPTTHNQQLEGSNDRVRAIVRVKLEDREELARRLHVAAANRAIHRKPGEMRFWINPKDLRER
jgi:primosomal protein N' (replication factor Y)